MSWNVKKRTVEYVIYLLFWSVLLLSPLFGAFLKGASFWPTKEEMFSFWEFLLPALILFFLNNNVLMPFLLYKKRGRLFVLYLLCIIVACSIIFVSFPVGEPPRPRPERQPHAHQHAVGTGIATSFVWEAAGDEAPPRRLPRRPGVWMFFVDPRNVQVLITVFALVFNICVRLFFFTIRRDERFKELEMENLRSNLEYLRYQINPHFFMNTLNNIHALIDIDKEKAQKTVQGFSRMMRYVLYDTSAVSVPLEKEMAFLDGYIGLMRLRYTDKLEVRTSFVNDVQGIHVPPMLFIQFVENAFKHGVTYKKKSIIDVALCVDEASDNVVFTCRNTMPETPAVPLAPEQVGIGVENARKRLELLYGEEATLHIGNDGEWYNVELKLPIQYDKVLDN